MVAKMGGNASIIIVLTDGKRKADGFYIDLFCEDQILCHFLVLCLKLENYTMVTQLWLQNFK